MDPLYSSKGDKEKKIALSNPSTRRLCGQLSMNRFGGPSRDKDVRGIDKINECIPLSSN